MITTPGTNVTAHNLTSWLDGLRRINGRAISFKRYQQIAAHWEALPLEWVRESRDVEALADMERVCERAHLKPRRGNRGGTKWELANMYRLNRLHQLAREAEWAAIGLGHNSRNAA